MAEETNPVYPKAPPPGEDTMPDQARYIDAAHAMQTGVAHKMHIAPAETEPKHLRVGINAAMVEHSALTRLLVAKGVITWEEYYAALADVMEEERDKYATFLSEHFGRTVNLA